MWKCIRCEKENPDSAENCMECGHGKTMNYRDYRTLAKVQSSVLEGWKKEQNTSEYFKKKGMEYLQKTIECLQKANESNRNIQYMITAELNKYFTVRENKERPILMADSMRKTAFGSNIRREDIAEIEFIESTKILRQMERGIFQQIRVKRYGHGRRRQRTKYWLSKLVRKMGYVQTPAVPISLRDIQMRPK